MYKVTITLTDFRGEQHIKEVCMEKKKDAKKLVKLTEQAAKVNNRIFVKTVCSIEEIPN